MVLCVDCGRELRPNNIGRRIANGSVAGEPQHQLDVVWLCERHHMEAHGRV